MRLSTISVEKKTNTKSIMDIAQTGPPKVLAVEQQMLRPTTYHKFLQLFLDPNIFKEIWTWLSISTCWVNSPRCKGGKKKKKKTQIIKQRETKNRFHLCYFFSWQFLWDGNAKVEITELETSKVLFHYSRDIAS